jgi:hypothetical protein
VEKYYSSVLKAWLGDLGDGEHDGGPGDPRIGVIRVEAKHVTYVVPAKGTISRAVETVKAAAKGESPAIHRIREITGDELAECEFFPLPLLLTVHLPVNENVGRRIHNQTTSAG